MAGGDGSSNGRQPTLWQRHGAPARQDRKNRRSGVPGLLDAREDEVPLLREVCNRPHLSWPRGREHRPSLTVTAVRLAHGQHQPS